MGNCLFALALVCFGIGIVQLLTPEGSKPELSPGIRSQRAGAYPVGAGQAENNLDLRAMFSQGPQGAGAKPTGAGPTGAPPVGARSPGVSSPGGLQKLGWIQVGRRIYTKHPVKGELMSHVLGKTTYTELWQTSRGPQSPWVPTGNSFAGFLLEGGMFLLNWQERFYLLDESSQLSDAEIQRDFAPHARQFAASDQTADVYFAYPPAMWHIDDIGKFRVEQVAGEGMWFRPGTIGRFVHASGDGGRALVLEDYESGGGGQDTVWTGYKVEESDIREA